MAKRTTTTRKPAASKQATNGKQASKPAAKPTALPLGAVRPANAGKAVGETTGLGKTAYAARLLTGQLALQMAGQIDDMATDDELAAQLLAEFPAGTQSPASYRGYINNPKHDMDWDTTDLPQAQADLVAQYETPYLYSKAKAIKLTAAQATN